jgi:hypothetical protein
MIRLYFKEENAMRRTHYILFAALLPLALGCQTPAENKPAQEVSPSTDVSAAQPSEVAAETPPSETATPDSECPYAKQLRAEGQECPYKKQMKAADGECVCPEMEGEGKDWSCPKMKAAHGECPYAKMKGEGKECPCPEMKAARGECPYAKMKGEGKDCPYAKKRGGHGSAATDPGD